MSEQQPADADAPVEQSEPTSEATAEVKPFFIVESGNPTDEEIAALTVVLAAAASGGDEEPAPKPVSGWASPSRAVRSIGTPGFGGWRAEYAPR